MAERHAPRVTIAIPTYHRARTFLPQALGAAVAQSAEDLEILVADNCSPDETGAVVARFADPRIRYVRHAANIGANGNFNFCVAEARGEYLLLLQDDDLVDPDFVEVCLRAAAHRPEAGMVRTGTRVIDAQGAVRQEFPNLVGDLSLDGFFLGWFVHRTSLYLCSTLFKTRALREAGGFHSRHALFQDVMATVRVAARAGRADVPEIKASFRKHPLEMTFAARVGAWCEDAGDLLEVMCDLAEDPARIRREGRRFFAGLCYGRAAAVPSPLARGRAYLRVLGAFGYRHLPSRGHLYRLVYGPEVHARIAAARRARRRRPQDAPTAAGGVPREGGVP